MRASHPSRGALPRAALMALGLGTTLLLGGCGGRLSQFTGSISDMGRSAPADRRPEAIPELARRYDARPGEKRASLDYAAALRANGQNPQAVAVLQRASIANVGDRDVSAAYGKALVDVGQLDTALQVLMQAHSEDRPNWQVLATMGSIADQQGNHDRAREFYHRSLQIAPNEPSTLNNLGLSYMLTKELPLAEQTLRRAASLPGADPRVQANLALAMRLQNKSSEPAAAPAAPVRTVSTASTPAKGGLFAPDTLWKANGQTSQGQAATGQATAGQTAAAVPPLPPTRQPTATAQPAARTAVRPGAGKVQPGE
jgi:Flp pilus assembly protein TadD